MKKVFLIAVIVFGLGLAYGAQAYGTVVVDSKGDSGEGPVVYAHDSRANLFTVDIATGAASLIGNTGQVFTDIAFDSSGRLYGIGNTGFLTVKMALFEIDPIYATTSNVGSLVNGGFVNALVFDNNGELWAASDDSFVRINPLTGYGEVVSSSIKPYGSSGDLAIDSTGISMYLTTDTGQLVEINRNDGTITEIGSLPQTNLYGLGRGPDNIMYAISLYNEIFSVNLSSGNTTFLRDITASSFTLGDTYGLSFPSEAIPEPTTIALLALGGLGLVRQRKKRLLKL